MIVMKFGGTSVGNPHSIRKVGTLIEKAKQKNPVIVVSALSGITDKLDVLSKKIFQISQNQMESFLVDIVCHHLTIACKLNCTRSDNFTGFIKDWKKCMMHFYQNISDYKDKEKILYDIILCQGEWLSSHLLTAYLRSKNLPAVTIDAKKIIKTDSQFTKAQPDIKRSESKVKEYILPLLASHEIPVIQGFIGSDCQNKVTTLGRGGSDLTATLLGCLLKAEMVEIWSDVDGVLTADPSIIPHARCIRYMSFSEASELAYFGAKVLHPSTLLPAVEHNIPVKVLNTSRPADRGTLITNKKILDSSNRCIIKSIAYKENLTVITINSTRMLMACGFLAEIFTIFEKFSTSVDLVTTSEVSVSLTIDNTEHLDDIIYELNKFSKVEVNSHMAIVCLVGEQMKNEPRHIGNIFKCLQDIHIHMISQGASEINISFVIAEKDIEETIVRLHKIYFENDLQNELFLETDPVPISLNARRNSYD